MGLKYYTQCFTWKLTEFLPFATSSAEPGSHTLKSYSLIFITHYRCKYMIFRHKTAPEHCYRFLSSVETRRNNLQVEWRNITVICTLWHLAQLGTTHHIYDNDALTAPCISSHMCTKTFLSCKLSYELHHHYNLLGVTVCIKACWNRNVLEAPHT